MSGIGIQTCLRGSVVGLVAAMTAAWAPIEAAAQQPPASGSQPFVRAAPARNETVANRRRPQYDPVGIRRGSFFIYPSFAVSGLYDSNIFATPSDRKQDFIVVLSPEIAVRSNWRRHQLNFGARADVAHYKSHTKENYQDAAGILNGRYDISGNTFLFAGIEAARRHEDRGDPNDAGGKTPTTFWTTELTGGVQHVFGRFTIRFTNRVRLLDYKDVAAAGVGEIDNDDRDRREWEGVLRLTYRVNPRISVFGQATGEYVRYNERLDSDGFNRDNSGFEVAGGVAIELTGKLFGEVFVGWSQRYYRDPTASAFGAPSGGASLTWTPTGLTTVIGTIVSSIEESTITGASGFYSTNFRVSVDHELRRNVLLNGYGSYQFDDYQGISRKDQWIRAGGGVTLLVNRHLNVFGGYEFTRSISDAPDEGFTRHLVIVRIKGQL